MIFNSYSRLEGKHAVLSASKYHWINYDLDKMERVFTSLQAAAEGSAIHDLAAKLIRHRVKLAANGSTLSMYVNDAIGYKMHPEQILYYSDNAFGTADAIQFRRNKLRIHDLKTGSTKTSEWQLIVYAAYFCLEYNMRPHDIQIELRIYQNDEVQIWDDIDPDIYVRVMDKIKMFDARINELRLEALS